MPTFTDTAGRQWPVELNVAAIKRVKQRLGVDLLQNEQPESVFLSLAADPVLLVDVLYVICGPDISDEDFGAAMAGDAIEAATEALLEALADFSPSPRDRERIRRVHSELHKLVDRVHTNLDQAVEAAISGEPSTSSPESPESIRGR